jgi:uncharacterized protein (TIGR02597 family)
MKQVLSLLLVAAFIAPLSAQSFRAPKDAGGSQYVLVPADSTVVVAPQFQRPSVGTFRVTGVTTVGDTSTLQLSGKPPLDSYDAPLQENQYQAGDETYYAIVTAGDWTGYFFTITANTANTLEVHTGGLTGGRATSVRSIEVRPYWSLETLFPSSTAEVSFIPTTDPADVKTRLVLPPLYTTGTDKPQETGDAFYYSSTDQGWVSAADPATAAGKVLVAPGRYVYLQNTGAGSYPLDAIIAGTVLTAPLRQTLYASEEAHATITYFALARTSDYKLSQIGLTDANFTPSEDQSLLGLSPSLDHTLLDRKDVLIVDDGFGGVGALYYRYKKKWYTTTTALPVDPVLPAGTVFGVLKKSGPATEFTNRNNL